MGLIYRALWVLKALWIILSETINLFIENCKKKKKKKKKKTGMPPKILP